MVGEISREWFWFLVGNLLSDTGIALFALITYKINEVTSKFSHKLLEEVGEASAAAAERGSAPPEPTSAPDSENPPDHSSSSPPNVPDEPFTGYSLVLPKRDEIDKWQGRQWIPLILFVIGIVIQVAVLIIPYL